MMSNQAAVLLEKIRDADPAVRRRAVRDLGAFPQLDVAEALAEALGDPNKGVQNTAIETLSRMGNPVVIAALLPIIRGSDLNTRNAGMWILKSHGPVAIAPLLEALNKASDVDEVIQILVVLGNIGSPLATDAVMKMIEHEDDNVKTTAVEALGKIQDSKAVKKLINTYHQTDILKYSILEALGNIAQSDATPIMMGAVDSEDVLECFSGIGAMGAMEDPAFVAPLFRKLLKEDDAGTRRLILKSLSQIEETNPGAIASLDRGTLRPVLLSLLEQHDAAEYIHIVRVAAAVKDEAVAASLLGALESNDGEVVETAFRGLLLLGAKAVPAALEKVTKASPVVAVKILDLLEKIPHHDTPKTILVMAHHQEDNVRQAVTRALAANPSDISFGILKELLADVDEQVRRNAVVGIKNMLTYDGALSALVNAMKDVNGHVRREAALALQGSSSKQIVEPLLNQLKTEPYGDVRESVAMVLASRKDPDITRRLLEFLDGDNSRIRETVAKTVWQCGATHAVDSLIRKLTDKEWRVIVNACQSLEKMKDLKSIFPLKELLKHDDWQIRIAALSALRAFRSKELKQFFVPLVGDTNPIVAKMAVEALSELDDKSLEEIFRKNVDHKNWEVRYQIVKALGKIKSQKAVDALINVVEKDVNNGVRAKALLALAAIKDKKAFPVAEKLLQDEDRDLTIAAVKFFLKFDPSDVTGLEDKLKKIFLNSPWIKNYFIISFGENESPLLEKALEAVSSPRDRRRVARAKGKKTESGLTVEEMVLLKEIIAEKCGIDLVDRHALERQLGRDRSKFYITPWMEYYHALKYGTDDQNLLISLYDTITDPRTGFFCESDQNKVLVETIIPELLDERVKNGNANIRILSAGCSYGPEAYSLAMSILEEVHSDPVKLTVTGVDISHVCLNTAKRGIYKREMLRHVDQKYIDLYFEDDRGDLRAKDEVKNLVEFKYLNLSSTHEMEAMGTYDVVICRNVFGVFSQREREKLAENLYNILAPGGALFISGRESLYNVTKAFKLQTYDRVVVYRKV
ncbi:MAG: HEAT repeat domain-containing protein [Candidatus Ozemobacteraceae bacterium]